MPADLVYNRIGYVRLYHTIIPTTVGLAKVCPYANFCEKKRAHQLPGCPHFALHFAIFLESFGLGAKRLRTIGIGLVLFVR